MATDYDASRKQKTNRRRTPGGRRLTSGAQDKTSGKVDEDEIELAESYELPGADLSHETLSIEVTPKQAALHASLFSTNLAVPHQPPTSVETVPERSTAYRWAWTRVRSDIAARSGGCVIPPVRREALVD